MANETAEFARNYEHCYFRVQLRNAKQYRAFMLSHWDLDRTFMGKLVTRTLQDKATSFNAREFMESCEPMIGSSGYVNVLLGRPVAAYLQVNPDRQYRKALSIDKTCTMSYPSTGSPTLSQHLLQESDKRNTDVESYVFKAYLHQLAMDGYPIFRGIRTAVALVDDGTAHSVAISKFFAVSLAKGLKYPVLWYKNKREGVICNDVCYASDAVLPFKEFFAKRFDFPLLPLQSAPAVK